MEPLTIHHMLNGPFLILMEFGVRAGESPSAAVPRRVFDQTSLGRFTSRCYTRPANERPRICLNGGIFGASVTDASRCDAARM